MNCMRSHLGLLVLSAAYCLPAQQQIDTVAPHISVEFVGPDGWRARVGPTNLGVLLASEQGRALWGPMVAPMLQGWAAMAGDDATYRAASERLFGYSGTMRAAIHLDDDDVPSIAVSFEGDRRTDMAAIAADMTQLMEAMIPGAWQDRQVLGARLQVREVDGECVSAPVVDGDRMTMLIGAADSLPTALGLRAWLAARPSTVTAPKPGSPALRVTLDLAGLIPRGFDENDRDVLAPLGLDALRELTWTVSAAGPRVQLGADVTIDGPPRGVVQSLMSSNSGVSPLARLLPGRGVASKVARFDAEALFEGLIAAFETDGSDSRKRLADELGVDLARDLFAFASDEVMAVGSPLSRFDRGHEATWLLAWRLEDEAKFREGFEKLMKSIKGFISPSETVRADGVELRRYGNLLRYDLWMAVGNNLWGIAAGRDAEEELTALLKKAAAADWSAAPVPAAFADLKRHLPDGFNGFASADIKDMLTAPTEWWYEGMMMFLAPPLRVFDEDELGEMAEAAGEMLEQNNLSKLRSATGFSGGTWRWRLYW